MPDLVFAPTGAALVRERFRRFNIKLPTVQVSKTVVVRPTVMTSLSVSKAQLNQPMLFQAGSNSPADLAQQQAMHELYDSMFQQIIAAIESGFNTYRQTAGLVGVIINGPLAIGGQLQGPPLDPLIKTAVSVVNWTGSKVVMRDAVARGFDQQWSILSSTVKVPGLPWYPTFAAFPGPTAPPTPNVPTPFSVLIQDPSAVAPLALKVGMRANLRGQFDYSDEFFESIATGFDSAMQVWKATQMVRSVLGMGPVPNFAPPYVPVGPVVGGSILGGSHINT